MNTGDNSQGQIRVGTSGWSYKHWRGRFYPEELPETQWLDYYWERFSTVELNNTFYQLPDVSTLQNWRENTPEDFLFSVKASRYITHMKKLKDPEEPVETFITRVEELGSKMGPVLFQLPPGWNLNFDRLREFLRVLPSRHRCAFEFRDPSWITDSVLTLLQQHNAAFCIYEFDGYLSPKHRPADFAYIRLHGPNGAYRGRYDKQTLAGWAGAVTGWSRQGTDVFCYFDNDQRGHAATNAAELRGMVEK